MRTLRLATKANATRTAEACAAAGYLVHIQNTGRHYLLTIHPLFNNGEQDESICVGASN